jgi:hypothetical protein
LVEKYGASMRLILFSLFLYFCFFTLNAKDKYLIITTEDYYQSNVLQEFINYRSNDFEIDVVLNSYIGNSSEDFKNYLNQKKPDYVLIVGNYMDFPARTIPYSKPVESYNYWVADHVDSLFRINIPLGLFLINDENELKNIIYKTIRFEKNIGEIPNKLYTHSGSITPLEPWPLNFNDELLFEMYDSFFKKNNYLHQHESSLDETPNDAVRDVEAINNGVKYIIYHGHGNINKWSFGMGVEGIKYLSDQEYFPIIFSASCLTGTFTGRIDTMEADCFATNMVASEHGAVAFIGAYNTSTKGQNPILYGFSKYVNNNSYKRLGDVLLKAFNSIEMPETVKKYYPHILSYEYNRARLQFHLFGDPALLIQSESTNVSKEECVFKNIISPNPTSEYFDVNLEICPALSKCETSEINIYNTFGELVITKAQHLNSTVDPIRIDVSDLPDGTYFIQIGSNSEIFIVLR